MPQPPDNESPKFEQLRDLYSYHRQQYINNLLHFLTTCSQEEMIMWLNSPQKNSPPLNSDFHWSEHPSYQIDEILKIAAQSTNDATHIDQKLESAMQKILELSSLLESAETLPVLLQLVILRRYKNLIKPVQVFLERTSPDRTNSLLVQHAIATIRSFASETEEMTSIFTQWMAVQKFSEFAHIMILGLIHAHPENFIQDLEKLIRLHLASPINEWQITLVLAKIFEYVDVEEVLMELYMGKFSGITTHFLNSELEKYVLYKREKNTL